MAYKQGANVRVSNVFTQAGVAADPTTVLVTIVRPDGQRNEFTYLGDAQVVKASTGNYYIDLSAVIPGTWTYWWHSEGTGQAADEKTFIVEPALGADAPGDAGYLGLTYSELQRAVGRELGTSRDPGTWQPNERIDAHDIIRSCYRRFLWHEPVTTSALQGKDGQMQKLKQTEVAPWSFMEVTASLSLASGTADYDLPEDFGEMVKGGFIFTTDQQPIDLVSYEQILQMRSKGTANGIPKYASVGTLDTNSNKHQAAFYPTPNANFTVKFTYSVSPKELNEKNPIPLGGAMHAETIIEACLAACEKILYGTEGVHEKKYQECLARSIQSDANLSATTEEPWPLEDKAKGLGITKAYLNRLIGLEMHFGAHSATWGHAKASKVDLALETGLRKFYAPLVLPNERFGHEWKFLKPVGTITTASGISKYDLPKGFINLDGPLTFAPDEGDFWPSLEVVPEYRIRQMLSQSDSVGRPQYAAIRAKPIDPAGGTHYELVCWPPADDAYEISFLHQVNPAGMDNNACLPYGGQQHAQTLIEACLAAAEEQIGLVNGPHAAKFLECLIASVSSDRKTGCPEKIGVNSDHSDRFSDWDALEHHHCQDNLVTYEGQSY